MTKQPDPVTFTPDTLDEITPLYDAAVATGKAEFTYRNREYTTRYVVYLIEYLRGKWGLRREAA
jgi:hypothetical protein